jgi:hypothetical protein
MSTVPGEKESPLNPGQTCEHLKQRSALFAFFTVKDEITDEAGAHALFT